MKLASTVKSKPNFYEMLGLTPTATDGEISRAFARECNPLRPHVFGVVAEICIAYETLRDPAKRRAYDTSLGLKPEAEPKPKKHAIGLQSVPVSHRPASAIPARKLVADAPQSSAPRAISTPRPDRIIEPAPQSINPELRHRSDPNLPGSAPQPSPPPELRHRAETTLEPRPISQNGGDALSPLAWDEDWDAGAKPIEGKRLGLAAGGLVAAASLIGGLAGWWSGSDVNASEPAENSASVSLPAPKQVATVAAPIAPIPSAREIRPDRPQPAAIARARNERAAAKPQLAAAEEPPLRLQAAASEAGQSGTESNETEPLAVEASAAPAVAASLPLSNKMVARTIERIGYSCGGVAATTPVEGDAPGVFKVTCTSGQSYQARPVRGRYHFRRWGRQ